MLTIVCGEDSSQSRVYYSDIKNDYKNKYVTIVDILSGELSEITKWMGESTSLFSSSQVFFTQNLNKKLSKKTTPKQIKIIEEIIKSKSIHLVDWEEDIPARYLKFGTGAKIKEFKLNESIFKLQETLFPDNFKNFVVMLNILKNSSEEVFIFIMLQRYVRNLLLVKMGLIPGKLASWQIGKLKNQAASWKLENLVNFYDSFHKIDASSKTSSNPFSLSNSLDLLASYYL